MAGERWEIDSAHAGINFSVRHMMVAKVRGRFARSTGTISQEGGDFGRARVDVVIDATSSETGLAERDAHLKATDFLDTATHREITFAGNQVEKTGRSRLRLGGELTIRGVTRAVVLDVEYAGRARDPWGNERAGFTAKSSIDRRDFGLAWNQILDAGGLVVGDRVDVEIDVEAVRQGDVETAAARAGEGKPGCTPKRPATAKTR